MGKNIIAYGKQVDTIPFNLQLFGNTVLPNDGNSGGGDDTSGDTTSAYVSGNDEDVPLVGENEGEETPVEESAEPLKDTKQDPKIDSAFATLRREKENFEKQKKDLDTWVQENFGKDFGIKTIEEYKDMMEKQLKEQKENELREQGYDPNVIREIVKNDPEIRKVMTEVDSKKQEEKLVNDYQTLAAEYPEFIKQPEDITKDVWDLYDKGMSLVDAYTIVNRKTILDHARSVGKQQTLNSINSKSHLKAEGDGAKEGNDVQMPQDTLQMYMDMGMSRKEAFAHYKKLYG